MAWFSNDKKQANFFLSLSYKVMKAGKVPQHVAFIMDGNRRFAKKEHISRKDGHMKGFEKLTQVCIDIIDHYIYMIDYHFPSTLDFFFHLYIN